MTVQPVGFIHLSQGKLFGITDFLWSCFFFFLLLCFETEAFSRRELRACAIFDTWCMWGNEEQRERAVSSKCYDIRDGDCFLVIAPTDRFQNLFLLLKPQLMSVHSVHHTWVIQKNMLERFLCKKWKKYNGLPSSKADSYVVCNKGKSFATFRILLE